jgi:geranylgeranyl diphosphate synthase type II
MIADHHSRRYAALRGRIDRYLSHAVRCGGPPEFQEACAYVLAGGGKRLRAILVLLSCEAVGGSASRALGAGAAIEIMHNFTLVHDDIMDNAPSRRGRPTVHVRWDLNNALLVGDILLGLSYRHLLRTNSAHLQELMSLFTTGVIDVCEGQALDCAFEHQKAVSVREYFRMIEKKTARLISMATEAGALIGGGTAVEVAALRAYGHFLGRAFQLQDDLLDVVADEQTLGKAVGSDIMGGKKTFLLLTAAERARGKDAALLRQVLRQGGRSVGNRKSVFPRITAIYRRYGVLESAEEQIQRNTARALRALGALRDDRSLGMLSWLAGELLHRSA